MTDFLWPGAARPDGSVALVKEEPRCFVEGVLDLRAEGGIVSFLESWRAAMQEAHVWGAPARAASIEGRVLIAARGLRMNLDWIAEAFAGTGDMAREIRRLSTAARQFLDPEEEPQLRAGFEQMLAEQNRSDEAACRFLSQLQELAAERYEWQERALRAEAALTHLGQMATAWQERLPDTIRTAAEAVQQVTRAAIDRSADGTPAPARGRHRRHVQRLHGLPGRHALADSHLYPRLSSLADIRTFRHL